MEDETFSPEFSQVESKLLECATWMREIAEEIDEKVGMLESAADEIEANVATYRAFVSKHAEAT